MKKILSFLFSYFVLFIIGYSQPANDTCGAATPISLPTSGIACVTGTTVGATATTWNAPVCGQTVWTNDVWYTFVSTGLVNTITVSPTGSPAATRLGITVYEGGCQTFQGSGNYCAVSATNGGSDTVIQTGSPAGTQYWVEVSSFGTAGDFNLCINSNTPPIAPGNSCGTATPLCSEAPFNLASVPLGGSGFTPDCFFETPGAAVWYQFTVGVGGQLIWNCQPTGQNVELDWAIFDITNRCPTNANQNNEVACNWNYSGGASNPIGMAANSATVCPTSNATLNASLEICPPITLTAGKTYAIMINNYTSGVATGWNFDFAGSTFKMAPVDTFLVAPDTICGNNGVVNLTNNSVGAIWQQWTFGDGATSLAASPGTHNYTAPGTYFISLKDSSQSGCTADVSKSVLITPNPSITVVDDTICPSGTGTLTASASSPGSTYVWSSGAHTATITANPANTTVYTVTATSPTGCTGTGTGSIVVAANPAVSITPASATICPSGSATFTAGAGTAYAWSNAATTQSITVSPASNTTFTVTVTLSGGCTATASATLTVSNNSTATVTPSTATICPLGSATLTASAGTSYAWSNAATTQSITVSPTANTTYTVTVTVAGGCTATASSTVSVVNALTTSITPQPDNICPGNSTTLTAAAATGYLWSNGATTQTITVSPASTSPYSVTVTSGGTCTASASATVTVVPFVVTITPDTSQICAGQTKTLTSTLGSSYTWSNGTATAGNVVGPTVTTTYTVTVTNNGGCTASASALVEVDNPSITITPLTPTICAGQGITLTAAGPPQFAWSNGIFTDTNTVRPAITTTYTVVGTDAASCTASASVSVTVNPVPTSTFTVTSPLCVGQNGTITYTGTASNAAVFNWGFDGANIVSGTGKGPYQVNWSAAGSDTISLSITDLGCVGNADTLIVTVNAIPVSNAGIDTSYCSGSSAVIGTASTAGYTYAWSPATALSSSTVSNPTVSLTNTANSVLTQTYTVTTSNNGCTSSDAMVLTVNPVPVAQIAQPAPQCINGNSFNFTAGGTFVQSAATFAWNFGTNGTPDSSVQQSQTVVYSAAQTTAVTLVITQYGCVSNTALDSVTVYPMPVASFIPDTTKGCPGLEVCFTNTSTNLNPATYNWNFGDGQISGLDSPCHVYNAAGVYGVSLQVTAFGCSNTLVDTSLITIVPGPLARFTPSATVIQLPQTEVDFTNQSLNSVTYLWNFDVLGTSSEVNPSFNFTQYGLYTVTLHAYNASGCADSTQVPISVLPSQNFFIPNIFTPNNDGNNDQFYIQSEEGVTVIEFTIFDRWGEKVHDGQYPWDGTYKGKPCPNGVYVYVFKLQLAANSIGIKRTGSVTLMR